MLCWDPFELKLNEDITNILEFHYFGIRASYTSQRLEFQRITPQQTHVHSRSSSGSALGSYLLNIELGGLTWALFSVPIMCMHRGSRPKVSLRWQDLRLNTRTQNDQKFRHSAYPGAWWEVHRGGRWRTTAPGPGRFSLASRFHTWKKVLFFKFSKKNYFRFSNSYFRRRNYHCLQGIL